MKQNLDYKLIFALAAVGIIWGTTFLGIRVAVETIPPWFVTSIRQGLAGLIILTNLTIALNAINNYFKFEYCSPHYEDYLTQYVGRQDV